MSKEKFNMELQQCDKEQNEIKNINKKKKDIKLELANLRKKLRLISEKNIYDYMAVLEAKNEVALKNL